MKLLLTLVPAMAFQPFSQTSATVISSGGEKPVPSVQVNPHGGGNRRFFRREAESLMNVAEDTVALVRVEHGTMHRHRSESVKHATYRHRSASVLQVKSADRLVWPKAKGVGCQPDRPYDALKSVMLAIMWNSQKDVSLASELSNAYKPWFAEVIHIGSDDACNLKPSNFDRPGIFMYSCYADAAARLAQKMDVKGILFVADDVVFRPQDLAVLGLRDLDKAWLPGWGVNPSEWGGEGHKDPWNGWWWTSCATYYGGCTTGAYESVKSLFAERPDLQKQLNENLGCKTNCLPDYSVTDVLYLPSAHAQAFAELAHTFRRHRAFTEAAVPLMQACY